MADVSVVGELNVDIILRGINGFPELDKEKLALEGKVTLGSSSAIFAVGLSRLGLDVNFIGAVGEDVFGRYIIETLKKERINTKGIKIIEEVNTGFTVSLTYPENRALITYPGVMENFTVTEKDKRFIYGSRHLHISSYFLQKKLQQDVKDLYIYAKSEGLTTSLDPGWDPEDSNWNKVFEILPYVDILFVNEIEAKRLSLIQDLSEEINLEEVTAKLAPKVRTLVVKLGAKGALAINDGMKYYEPGFKVDVVDTTGAGDSFNAGFIYAILKDYSINDSLTIGNVCGALSCTGIGGTTKLPTEEELKNFLKKEAKNG
ncbi:MAG: carbohydrate kinase family protein [bacterium]